MMEKPTRASSAHGVIVEGVEYLLDLHMRSNLRNTENIGNLNRQAEGTGEFCLKTYFHLGNLLRGT